MQYFYLWLHFRITVCSSVYIDAKWQLLHHCANIWGPKLICKAHGYFGRSLIASTWSLCHSNGIFDDVLLYLPLKNSNQPKTPGSTEFRLKCRFTLLRNFRSENPAGVCLCHMFERDKVFIAGGDTHVSTSCILVYLLSSLLLFFKTTVQFAPNETSFPLFTFSFS